MSVNIISAKAFAAMQNLNIDELANCTKTEIRPLLPSLVRMTLLSPIDNTKINSDSRKKILSILVGIEIVNNIVSLLQVNYHELETDVKKEQQLRYYHKFISIILNMSVFLQTEKRLYTSRFSTIS